MEPTRITAFSSSMIDHVFTNSVDEVKGSGVIMAGFSDHFLTYVSRGMAKGAITDHNIKQIRSFKQYSREKFNEVLGGIDWSSVLLSTDVNVCLNELSRLFKAAIDTVAPVRDVRVKQKPSPWLSSDLL